MLFASFSDTMSQGLMWSIFFFATLIVMGKQFAAKHPDTAKKAGSIAGRVAASAVKRHLK